MTNHIRQAVTLTLPIITLTACPVEWAADEYCRKHCTSSDSEAATSHTSADPSGPTSSASSSHGEAITTSPAGDSFTSSFESSDATTAESSAANDTGALTEAWSDEAPVLGEFVVTPDPVVTAGFIALTADCADDWGVAEIRFLVDGELLAAAPVAPFAADWLVKAPAQVGDHTLTVECEDIAGNVVSDERVVSVSLPTSGTAAWAALHPALKGNSAALDAAAAPDGSWWVCGYADNVIGGTAAWVAHYSAGGELLFDRVISRGKDQTGQCAGIAVASDDSHRAVLTGGFGLTGQWPHLWTALVDETVEQPLLAESNDALSGHFGNDVLVNKYGQFEVAGQVYLGKDDWDMTLWAYNYKPGHDELTTSVGITYGTAGKVDFASAIVENPDGTVTLVGTLMNSEDGVRAAAIKLNAKHQPDTSGAWPFTPVLKFPQADGATAGSIDGSGTLRITGWHRDDANSPSRVMTWTLGPDGAPLYDNHLELSPQVGDNAGQGIAHFSDGTYLISGSVTAGALDHDIWTTRLTAGGDHSWKKPLVFGGLLGSLDEPRDVGINPFDQALIVGFETVIVQQDGKPVAVRRAWLQALHG